MYNLSDDIFEVIFATEQQTKVGKMLIDTLKGHGGVLGKTEMSLFATRVHDGTIFEIEDEGPIKRKQTEKISYNKRQFYDRILTPMKSMGMIDYDLYKKVYKLSDRFNKNMLKVGLMWVQEVRDSLPS